MNEFEITPEFKKAALESVKELLRLEIGWIVGLITLAMGIMLGTSTTEQLMIIISITTNPVALLAQQLPLLYKAGDRFKFKYEEYKGNNEPKGLLPTMRSIEF